MMNRALLASALATGLVLPAQAGVYIPSKPAIIKPENIEFTKHLILGMPITMGMLSGSRAPVYLSDTDYTQTTSSTGARTWTHTTTSATNCLVVAYGYRTGNAYGSQSCTFNGVSMTQGPYITLGSSPGGAAGIFYLLNPPVGSYTVSLSTTSNQRVGASAVNTTAISTGPTDNTSGTSSTITTSVTTTQAAVCIAVSSHHQNSTVPSSLTGTTLLAFGDGTSYSLGVSYTQPASSGSQSFSHTYSGSSGRKTMALMAFY